MGESVIADPASDWCGDWAVLPSDKQTGVETVFDGLTGAASGEEGSFQDGEAPGPEISIAAGLNATEGDVIVFIVSANPPPLADLEVSVTVGQKGDFGVSAGSQTVTIPTGGTAFLDVTTVDDGVDEADGSVTVTVDDGSGYTVSVNGAATVSVADDDSPVCVPVLPSDGVTVSEVTGWRDGHSGAAHVLRWNRVLAALGVDTGVTALTVEESRVNEDLFIRGRWDRVTRTLEAIAQCDTPPVPEVSIAAGGDVTEGGDATFTLTATPAPSAAFDVSVSVTQSGDYGVASATHTVTIPTGGAGTLTVATSDDSVDEADGSVTATVDAGGGYTVSATAGSGTVAVADDDSPVCVPVLPSDAVTVSEVTGWRDGHSGAAHVLRWNRVLAALGVDTGVTALTVEESRVNEDLFIRGRWDRVTRTLEALAACDNPPPPPVVEPVVSVAGGGGVSEGDDATFTLTASPAPSAVLVVDVTVSQSGDFGVTTGSRQVTIPTSGSVGLAVATSGDSVDESDGSVTVTVDDGQGYRVSSTAGAATVAVADDDVPPPPPPPSTPRVGITADRGGVTEGDDVTFTLTAIPAPVADLIVTVSVAQTGDYGVVTGSRQVVIPTGGSVTLSVATIDDSTDEADGSVTVTVDDGQGYTVSASDGSASVTVADDDVPPPPPAVPEVSVAAGGAVTEGEDATFTLTADPAPGSSLDVTVSVTQQGDFGVTTGSRQVTIPTSGSVALAVATSGDSTDESDGSVTVTVDDGQGYRVSQTAGTASVAVADDDVPPPVVSVAGGGGVSEGDDATFTLTASPAPSAVLVVDVTVTQSGDFGVTTGSRQVTIPTSGTGTLVVATSGDSTDESDGSVTVTVDDGAGYRVSQTAGTASVAVADDDPASVRLPPNQVSFSVEDASGTEGETLRFRVMLSNAANARVRVWWTTRYGGGEHRAYPGRDYPKKRGWLAFAPGETEKWVEIPLGDDSASEPSEVFQIYLGFTEGGATIADRDGIMTIIDND